MVMEQSPRLTDMQKAQKATDPDRNVTGKPGWLFPWGGGEEKSPPGGKVWTIVPTEFTETFEDVGNLNLGSKETKQMKK